MTRIEIEMEIEEFANEQKLAYKNIKNKIKARISLPRTSSIPSEFMDIISDTIDIPMDASIGEVGRIINAYDTGDNSFKGDPLHINTSSSLEHSVSEDCLDELYFYVQSKKLKSNMDDVDFSLQNKKLRSIINTALSSTGYTPFYIVRRIDDTRFISGEIEFDQLLINYIERRSVH